MQAAVARCNTRLEHQFATGEGGQLRGGDLPPGPTGKLSGRGMYFGAHSVCLTPLCHMRPCLLCTFHSEAGGCKLVRVDLRGAWCVVRGAGCVVPVQNTNQSPPTD